MSVVASLRERVLVWVVGLQVGLVVTAVVDRSAFEAAWLALPVAVVAAASVRAFVCDPWSGRERGSPRLRRAVRAGVGCVFLAAGAGYFALVGLETELGDWIFTGSGVLTAIAGLSVVVGALDRDSGNGPGGVRDRSGAR